MPSHCNIAVFLVRYSLRSSPPVQDFLRFLCRIGRVRLYLEGVFEPLPDWMSGFPITVTQVRAGEIPSVPGPADAAIAFDLEGLILCGKTFPGLRPLYYSLELYLPGEAHCAERVFRDAAPFLPTVQGLIIQSRERAEIFLREFGLPDDLPLLLLPVTYEEASDRPRSGYLRHRYGIPDDRHIVLHMGEITAKYNAWNIARAFKDVPDWTLVFHGPCRPAFRLRMEQRLRQHHMDHVILSEEFCADFAGLREILLSADVGLVWYANITRNLSTAGWASAKIAAYFAHGVPVIGNRLRSVVESVEAPACGLTVRDPRDIPAALAGLLPRLPELRETVRARHAEIYRFALYEKKLENFVRSHALCSPLARVA